MLGIDLARLARLGTIEVDAVVPADDPLWSESEVRLAGPLGVHLVVQAAGRDVVVRGLLECLVTQECRRCLKAVEGRVEEEVTFLFGEGAAEDEDAYGLPEHGNELDLSEAVREHVVLAVPRFVECSESCRGLCPRCGRDLNEGDCDCRVEEEDERWAPLRKLMGRD